MERLSFEEEEGQSFLHKSINKDGKQRSRIFKTAPIAIVISILCIFFTYQLVRPDSYVDANYDQSHKECSNVDPELHKRLVQQTNQRGFPSIFTISNNRLLTDEGVYKLPLPICILVIVPQIAREVYVEAPINGAGPDAIHVTLSSLSIKQTFQPLRIYEHSNLGQYSQRPISYYAESTLIYPGIYQLDGEHEWSNWDWGMRWHLNDTHMQLSTGQTFPSNHYPSWNFKGTPILVEDKHPRMINVKGLPASRPQKRCYDPENGLLSPGKGKWVFAKDFQAEGKMSQLNADAEVKFASTHDLIDEWGYTWAGDDCELDYIAPEEAFECLENQVIHIFGDSMLRRVSKLLMSANEWCFDKLFDKCQCEDDDKSIPVYAKQIDSYGTMTTTEFDPYMFSGFEHKKPFHFGRNTTLYFTFLEALHESKQDWMGSFFDNVYEEGGELHTSGKARQDPSRPKADILLFGVGAWDQAFDVHFTEFEETIDEFRDAILGAYSDAKSVIMRLSNSYCCTKSDVFWRRYTGPRVQRYSDLTRASFQISNATVLQHQGVAIDPSNMGGRMEVKKTFGTCGSNHPRVSHHRLENQMLLNALCKKENGRTVLRKQER